MVIKCFAASACVTFYLSTAAITDYRKGSQLIEIVQSEEHNEQSKSADPLLKIAVLRS